MRSARKSCKIIAASSLRWRHGRVVPAIQLPFPLRVGQPWPRAVGSFRSTLTCVPCRWLHSSNDGNNQGPDLTYFPDDDVENLEAYRPGGFHPAIIGEKLADGRYTIVHKLGYGSYSAIWLARDEAAGRYVSLKISVASETPTSHEAKILRRLSRIASSNRLGRRIIPHLLAEFMFEGPNGHHICLVQEPAGPSISLSKEASNNFMFPPETARSIAAQLITGLALLHEQGGCHGGNSICIMNFASESMLTVSQIYT